ncbi:MAG: tetratricopeptide repeat protein [Pseudomonadota bacterium]
MRRAAQLLTLLISLGVLAACETSEERAEKHFQAGLAHAEAGDTERALIELRNVFQLNGFHRDARYTYATLEQDRGNLSVAYSQLLRLVEQYPEDIPGRRKLAEISLLVGNWEEVQRHLEVGQRISPDDIVIRAVQAATSYRNAIIAQNEEAARAAGAEARAVLEIDPSLASARRVVIDDLLRAADWDAALDQLDEAIAREADDRRLYALKLRVLEELGEIDAVEAHLRAMVETFDEDASLEATLVRWYVFNERVDDAEAYLRSRLDSSEPEASDYAELITFLVQFKGNEEARAEITRILSETNAEPALMRTLRAGLDFDEGRRDEAIAELREVLQTAGESEQTNNIKITLANMLIQTDNNVGARALVEEVLADDPGQVAGLKLKAEWLIEDDMSGDAIVDLRQALDQSPRDPEIMTLLARAYERSGNRDLMREMLSLAVEASGGSPAESLRYAQLLLQEEKFLPAQDVLLGALRVQPQNTELLGALGEVYLRSQDFEQAAAVVERLASFETDEGQATANALRTQLLARQERTEELQAFLETQAEASGDANSVASVLRLRLAMDDLPGARAYLDEQLAAEPDNRALQFMDAGLKATVGETADAVATFESLLEEEPRLEQVWVALYNLHRTEGDAELAAQTLDRALVALPDSGNLNWMKASELELTGDIPGAIAVYEKLYALDSNSPVIANNLASLISAYRTDEESLQRAFTIARRLRGATVPQFQDTYGWITHRLGNHEEALQYLEPAAEALSADPLVQFHLGQVYVALDRRDEAVQQFNTALTLIQETGARPELMLRVQNALSQAARPASIDN